MSTSLDRFSTRRGQRPERPGHRVLVERDPGHLLPVPAAVPAAAGPEHQELGFRGNDVGIVSSEPRGITVGTSLHSVLEHVHAPEVSACSPR
jgi:hypothetical protein